MITIPICKDITERYLNNSIFSNGKESTSMDFIINEDELAALCGLPHIQQLAYIRGIRH